MRGYLGKPRDNCGEIELSSKMIVQSHRKQNYPPKLLCKVTENQDVHIIVLLLWRHRTHQLEAM